MSVDFLKSRRFSARVVVGMLLVACVVMLAACSDDEKDPITIRVFSYYSNFTGSYIVNGNTSGVISGGTGVPLPNGDTIYYYELLFGELDQVEVTVMPLPAPDFIAIRVYRDGVKVKEAVASLVTTLSLTYTYDEEDVSEGE